MTRQFKATRTFQIKAESGGRTRSGICAVFGNTDDWGDRLHPGAFKKTISEGRSRTRHLWNHDFSQPPIASIKELKELSRDELPPEVLEFAPEATGGLLVTREYYENNPLSEWVLKALDAGDITEMSFGFDVKRYEITKEGDGENQKTIRELREVQLYDTSDVLWGMNNSTLAVSKSALHLPLGSLALQLQMLAQEVKAGRRNAASDETLINMIHRAALDLGCSECKGIITEETEETPKSKQAEAVSLDTSLSSEWLKLRKFEFDNFNF